MVLGSLAGDIARYALAAFLILSGLGLAFVCVKLAGMLGKLSSLIDGAEREVLPVINKVGGSVERVNGQLDKLDTATDSAVDAVQAVDTAVRTVSYGVRRPIEKLVGLSSGVSHGFATLKAKRSVRGAMESAKEAAARREADFVDELGKAAPIATPVSASPARATPPPPPAPPAPRPAAPAPPVDTPPSS